MRGRSCKGPRGAKGAPKLLDRILAVSRRTAANLDYVAAECSAQQGEPVTREMVVTALAEVAAWELAEKVRFKPKEEY